MQTHVNISLRKQYQGNKLISNEKLHHVVYSWIELICNLAAYL